MSETLIKGRGSQFNEHNPFEKLQLVTEHLEALDEPLNNTPSTRHYFESPKKIVSISNSPDLGLMHSINPYQGCEHGCAYCYARNSHNYWGFSSGLDFESKIIVKRNAPQMLDHYLSKYQGEVQPIFLSGNTDCYQPSEKKFQLTRQLLLTLYQYRYPVSIITKNSLLLRDLDILKDLAAEGLLQVFISITSLNESLRRKMEPRTATAKKKMQVIETLAKSAVPVGIMNAPVIPGLTDHEMPKILKMAADNGALTAGYALVRLNGTIANLFRDWVHKAFPQKSEKILNQIADCHDGKLNDSQWHRRQKGAGNMAEIIAQVFRSSKKKYFRGKVMPAHDVTKFRRGGNYQLF